MLDAEWTFIPVGVIRIKFVKGIQFTGVNRVVCEHCQNEHFNDCSVLVGIVSMFGRLLEVRMDSIQEHVARL